MRTNIINLIYLFLFIHNNNASEDQILDQDNDDIYNSPLNDKTLMKCVVDLTQMTILISPTILILENENDDEDDTFYNEMIKSFADNNVPIAIQDKDNHEVNQTHDVYDGNVVIIVYFEDHESLFNYHIEQVDHRVKHLIITSEYTDESLIYLQKFNRRYIERDITFIIQDPTGKNHSIETFLPVLDGETCTIVDDVKSEQINFCSNGSFKTDIVFLSGAKMNYKKCPLKVGMATMFPFSKIPNKEKLKNYDPVKEIEGSDVEIMRIVADYFNATPEWYYLKRDEQNPYTNFDYVTFIANGSLDACAGGLYNIYGDLVSYSGIYTRQAVTWIYAIERAGRSWINLVSKLDRVYLFFIFYIGYSVLSYTFRRYDYERPSLQYILFYSLGALIGATSLDEPKSLKQKILDVFYLILTIYLSAFMSIQLFSFLTIERPSEMFRSNEDIMNSGRTVYLNPINKYFIQEEKYLVFANTSEDCGNFFDCTNKTLFLNGLTIVLDQYFYSVQAATAVNDEARIMKAVQNLVTIYQEILIRKDSPLVLGVQRVVTRLFEAGICRKLFKEAIGITVVGKAESASKNAVNNSYSCESGCAITLLQVAGVFYMWIIGCALSLCAFMFEIGLRPFCVF